MTNPILTSTQLAAPGNVDHVFAKATCEDTTPITRQGKRDCGSLTQSERPLKEKLEDLLEPRFLSRCIVVPFNKPNGELTEYLAAIWDQEADSEGRPDLNQIAQDADHCVRDALQALDLSLMTQGPYKV